MMNNTNLIEKNIEYLPFIYLTQSMKNLYQKGQCLARDNYPSVLITGESGTGKELLAKSIHYNLSPSAPFIIINCINLPFDHFEEKIEGCFSIFSDMKVPFSEKNSASEATLFLRDIGKLDLTVQSNLFNLLKQRFFEPKKGLSNKFEKLRLMFSYNQNGLNKEVKKKFDTNLSEAFHPLMLNILPLRDRKDDIQPLAQYFIDKFSKEYGKDVGGIHSRALSILKSHTWPENVSELRDIMENAVLLSQGPLITKEDIRFNISKKSIALESFLTREDFFTLEELERIYIQTVFKRVKKNKSKAAKILGISRNTLQRRIHSFEAVPPKKKSGKKNSNQPSLF
jgi:two-component system response regulator AtoC